MVLKIFKVTFMLVVFVQFITTNSAWTQDLSDPANVGSPLNPLSPLNPNSSLHPLNSGVGFALNDDSEILEIAKDVAFELHVDSIETNNYQDPDCKGVLNKLHLKDCKPEFQIELIVCNSKKKCVSRLGIMSGFVQAGATKVIRTKQNETHSCKDINLGMKNVKDFQSIIAKVVEKENDSYYVGFRLVEYNSALSNTVIGQKLWPISEFRQFELTKKTYQFEINNFSKTVSLKATVKIGNILD